MKKTAAVLLALLLVGGIHISSSDFLFASEEAEEGEEIIEEQENIEFEDYLKLQEEELDEQNYPDYEIPEEERDSYTDEQYQDDRG
jgi:hypothetical protein